jgi:L-aspartate oxidase
LASNSLLEALVYSDKIYHYLADTSSEKNQFIGTVSDWKVTEKHEINPDYVARTKAELQLLMRQNAGIVRNDADLLKARENLSHWKNEVEEKIQNYNVNAELYELQNMIAIGILIVQQSIDRKENRGGLVKINPKSTN